MLSGVIAGCGAPAEEETYRQVSVGQMTLSIPADWESGAEYFEESVKAGSEDLKKVVTIDGYHNEPTKTILGCMVMDYEVTF